MSLCVCVYLFLSGTIQYKVGTGSYGTSIPKGTDAGDYTVYYKVVGDSNNNDVAEKFFNAVLALMVGANKPVPTKLPTNDNEDISELLSGAARIATSF